MAKFLETKQTIDNSVKKKKKKQQTQVQPKTQPKKQSQPSQQVQQTTQRFTQKYGGGSSSGGSSRGRSSGTRQRTSQPSQQTLSTNERLKQKYGVGQTRSTSTPTSRYRSHNSRTESRLSQKSQSTVDRLSQKYGTNNTQQREEPEKRYKTKFSAKQQESLNRLDEKYRTGRVTGGKHSFMDNAADYSKNLVKAAGQGLELAGREDLALANRFSNPSSANKFYNRELNATDYEKNKQRMALRQEGLRQKIKQQQQEMSDLAEGQNSKLGRLGVEAAQSAGGMLADTMAGPFSLVHMGARVTEGAQGDVIDKVEPMKKKMLASGNYTPEEVDEMFKDVEKWDFANAIMQGTIEGLTEKMFGGIGLAKKVGGAGVLDKVAGRIAGSKLTSNMFGKVLAGTAEEIAEEEIGNPAQAFASNLIYGNKLQAANEDMTRRELQSQSDDIRSQVQSEDDARRIAENLSSDDFMEESIKSYMESGSSKKEATHLAELSRDYLTASLEGDTERMKELQDEMVDIIAGGENSMKEKWTLQDALDVGISTAMMTVATGVPGAMTTSAMGTAYKDANGMDRVRNLAQTALNLNTEESAKAQAIIDSIDNGDELTGTQVYDVMSWAQSAAVEAKEREQVKDDLAEKRMNEEDLMVMPSVVTENGYQLSEATEERFETIAEQTLSKIDELDIDAYKDGGMDAYEIADTVAAYETGTITAEQMNALNIENPENRSVFEEMTGIDLSKYNVTDRSGRINEAASNVAMQTALFAKAADNYVESARIEQENWNNTERGAMAETLSKRIGGQGDKAVYQAMMDVDPRDRSKFELMGRASETVYRFAYNTEGTWDEAEKEFSRRYPSLSNASLKAVFEAAKDDKATANTKYYGEAVKAGEALSKKSMDSAEQVSVAGKFTNDTDVTLKADDQVFLQDMASTFNVNIEAVESMPIRVTDRNGDVVERQANGQFNRDTNTLVINLNADVTMPLRAIVSHELTHSNAYAPDEMLKLLNYIRDSWYRNDPEGYTNAINERKSRYSAEQNLSDLDALEEIVADGAQDFDFWNDSELAERIVTEEPTLAAKIINTIKDILRRIRSMLMSDNITNEDYRNALFAHAVDMNEAERLWLNASKIAVSNKANQDIEAMHESLIEESNNAKLSISGDLSAFKDYVMNRKESSARWTDERIDRLIRENGASNPDYSQAYAVLMNPRDFLKLTLPDETLALWEERRNSENPAFTNYYRALNEDDLANEVQTPFLIIYSKDGTEVQGHEGRHRMRALMEAGIKSVPVVIRDTDTKYSKVPTKTMTLSSQDFGYDPVNNGATVEIRGLVPIKESNRDELIQKFGGDAQVRFSIDDLGLTDLDGNPITEEQAEIRDAIGPMVRFSAPTYREDLPKGKYIPGMNSGKGGFAGLSEIASGKTILKRVMAENNFSPAQIGAVSGFLDHMASHMEDENLQMRYNFIGWNDLQNARVNVRRDADGNIVSVTVSAMVVNGEYPVNFDMTTICNKREGVMEVIQELTRIHDADTGRTLLNSIQLTDEKMWNINKALKAEGIDTACLGCFVEARRYYTNRFIDKIDQVWNSAVREARKQLGLPEEEYFDFAKGKKVSGEDYNRISDLWTAYDESTDSKRSPSQRIKILMDEIVKNKEVDSPYLKLISAEDILTPEGIRGFKELSTHRKDRDMVKMIKSIYGTSAPKEILAFTPYNSEIALLPAKIKGQDTGDYLRSIGGTRVQSFSDFKMEHFFDHLQMVADEAARRFVNHGYSKVIAYPRLFGLTGRKINMSVMFDVLPAVDWQKAVGCSEEVAGELAQKYQGLQFVKEKPAENKDGRPYKPITIDGVDGYLTYLVSDADYVNSVYDRLYQENIANGMSEEEARRKANTDKPFEQSINYREAAELENKEGYKENVGIIAVAYGDEHLKMLLDDPNVRYIIPYHRSGLPVFIAQKTALNIARDYTDDQNTNKAKRGLWTNAEGVNEFLKSKYAKYKAESKSEYPAIDFFKMLNDEGYTVEQGKKNAKEKAALAGTGSFDVYEKLDSVKDIREISNAYLEHCIERNQIPVFHQFAGSPNYYKMLFDFAVTDGTTTNIFPQREVRNRYPGLDIDAKVAAGEEITDADYEEFYKEIERGLADQNSKTELRRNRLGSVLTQDLLARDGENSIIADSNIQHIVYDTPDYNNVKYGSEEAMTDTDRKLSISALDEPYMSAVNSGNMDEAQKYVDEAANRAGFRPVHRYHGSMNANFTVFDKAYAKVGGNSGAGFYFSTSRDDSESHYQDVEGADNYFKWSELAEQINDAVSEGTWKGYPELGIEADDIETYEDAVEAAKKILNKSPGTFDVYLNYKNPYIRDYKNSTNIYDMLMDDFDESVIDRDDYEDEWEYEDAVWEAKAEHIADSLYSAVYGAYQDIEDNYEVIDMPYIDEVLSKITEYAFDGSLTWEEIQNGIVFAGEVEVTNPNWTDSGDATAEFARAIIENLGFDAIEDREVSSKFGQLSREMQTDTEHIIVFQPEQIKLSDPVTYAEDGSVIPLSERFDPENNDIRYSMPTQDADGNILTDGQMEFFKNSQARDELGKLVPVYHATSVGGFTIFDPSYSDDKRSLFFSSSKDVANTYVGKHLYSDEDRLGEGALDIDSWDRLVDYAHDLYIASGLDWEDDYEYENLGWILSNKDEEGYMADLDEWGDTYDDAYPKWAEMAKRNDPEADKYRIRISLPYEDGYGDIDYKEYIADSVSELLSKVSTDPVPQVGYYQVYLNLENPLIIDDKGANWNSITLDSRIPSNTRLELITGEYLDALAESIEKQFMDEKNQRERNGYTFTDESLYTWPQYQKSKQYRIDAKEAKENGIAYLKTRTGEMLRADYSPQGLAKAINKYYGFEENDSEGSLIANRMLKDIGSGMDAYSYMDDEQLRELTGETHDTRGWAEIAQAEGYDGVIFRNVIDIDNKTDIGEDESLSDIFIAFNASQVKDTNNENPTDDPDIRYSFPPETEDEINSRKDYDHASSDDFEILNAYEQMIEDGAAQAEFMNLSDEHLNTAYFMGMMERYGKADKKARKTGKAQKVTSVLSRYEAEAEKMDAFYRSLTEETSMVYDDEYMEEGRRRMAKSKEDFYSNLNAKWDDRWLSGGVVLNVDSVKGNVRELVKATMANSSADAQYRIDTVNKTLFDMRTAYMFMKQGRQDIASAILYQSAQRMIGDLEFVADDTEYKNYKELRRYLRDTKIEFTDDYWEDIDWNAYRKKNFGRLKLIKGNKNSIDDGTYDELVRQWPEYFSDAEMEKNGYKHDVPGMMQQLDYVLDLNVQPVMEAYSSEAAADLAFSIADDLYTIMENGDRVTSIADRYKEKYDAKTKALKVRHAEALLRMREMRDKGIAEANRRFREYKAQQKESKYHSKYFDSITKSYDKLTERLLTNTKDKHIPEMYKKDLAQLLSAFDLQTVGSKKFEARTGRRSQKTIKMDAIKTVLTNIGARDQLFHVNDSITDIIDRLLGKDAYGEIRPANSIEGKTIDELPAEALKDIDQLLKALIHEFNTYESVRVGAKRQQAADIGTTQIGWCLDHADKFGKGKDYQNVLGGLDKLLNLDEVTPAYMFRMIDPNNEGIGLMYKELRRSFGRYVNNQKQLNKWMDEIIGEYHNKGKILGKYGANQIEKWRRANSAIEFEFGTPENPQKVELTPAQMMSIYCLAKRQQALQHMQQGGIVVMPVSFQARMVSDIKKNANYSLPVKLTDANIKTIVSRLTPEQKSVADKLQNLMATKMADWGNEASMNVIGIKLFEDPNYFPIKSDKAAMEKDFTEEQFAQMIRNFGFTKAVMPNANNSIAINDIFDVVAEHCNNMNLYNAYSETMNDFMKVYNYKEYHDDGSHYTVEQAIAHAYSRKATTFISSFMKDLNGNVSKERESGIDAMLNESLGNAKKASVFANGRVALQQPTALARAFYVIKPKYLKGVRAGKKTMQEMFEHSPIALWKSWGYYDINMGKSIEDLMMNEGSVVEDWMSDIYGKLDNRTWAVIWSMCKNETKDLHPEVEEGSDEFWEIVSERMDEVVDLTQVVDSPFHRSHLMRSKQFYHKVLTSFMAEPTLTFNMVRDGILRAREKLSEGNKREAAYIMSHTLQTFALSAFATAAMAAIWDVVRGKGLPEDDDDKDKDILSKMQGFYQAWVTNTMENFGDNANILGNIYYVKDIVSLFQGWDQKNLGLQGMKHLADAFRQMKGEDVHSKLTWYENALAGIGYLSGLPLKTIMNDGKTLFKMLGFDIPEPFQASIDWLDRIGKDAKSDTVKDINKGETSTTGVSSNASTDKPVETRLWTYDNAPFHVEDGSLADTFLNHFGINLTKSEIAAAEAAAEKAKREEEIQQITKGLEKYSGEDYDKHLWDKQALEGYSKALEDGDFAKAKEIEDLFLECGGSQSFIDEKKLYHYKKNYLKTITYDPSDVEIENQQRMKEFLLSHGMTESELSEKVYKSQTAKELKVAFLLNDEDAMVEELIPLVRAGLSEADYEKLWKNRKRVDLVKYKESGGKYSERLKSTGKYIWPVSGRVASESEINSYFGHRSSPGGVGSTNHQGIDLDGSMGDPVGAADGGTVVFAGWYGGAGKTVKIQHDDGTITQYSHLSWWGVKEGDVVGQGQTIGNVGSTGNSTGPHLHFGVIKNDSYVDPYEYLFS